ncbi:MAG TPA: glycosyl hydrolase, partial [Nannocystis exedens]|nr:glycosyl hydrolase [Nannocystis exedens]
MPGLPRISLVLSLFTLFACSTGVPIESGQGSSDPTADASSVAPTTGATASTSTGESSTSGTSTGESDTDTNDSETTGGGDLLCPATFRFKPVGPADDPRIAGEWHDFELATASPLEGPDGDGFFSATLSLPPGLHAYKIVYNAGGETQWILDPLRGRRKYIGETENSAIKVADCTLPSFIIDSSTSERPAPGEGSYSAALSFVDAIAGDGPDPDAFEAVLDEEGDTRSLTADELTIDDEGNVNIELANLADGKYTLRLRGATTSGAIGRSIRLVFWIEAEPFTWQGALIYMVVSDRFRDGDPGNNPGPTPMADERGDYMGGDLIGLRQTIADGTLDKLGVRAIWLTPFQTNPNDAYIASD